MKSRLTGLLLCTSALVFAVTPVHAATVTFNLSTVFSDGAVAPDGPAPYGTVILDDGGTAGSVQMTVNVSGGVGIADMTELYLNFDPIFDLASLGFVYNPSTGPAALDISTGIDFFQADGDGKYDIFFDFPTADGSTFSAGDTVVYDITSAEAITANSFNFLSAPGGGAGGPFLAASKWQSTGSTGEDSAWVGAVPVPAAVWLFGSGLLGLVGVARRKKA